MSIALVITTAGRAALLNAAHTGTSGLVVTAIGLSATAVVADASATALPGELKRVTTFGGSLVDATTLHVSIEDDSADVYDLRAFALYLSDGTLFALYGQADAIYSKTAASIGLLSADIAFADSSAGAISFAGSGFTNPPATTSVVGVLRFATTDEARAGTATGIGISPASAKAALLDWLLTQDGAGSGIDTDLWRGLTPAALFAAWFSSGSNANGSWRKTPDGNGGFILEQWGTCSIENTAEGAYVVTLPAAFADTNYVLLPVGINASASWTLNIWPQRVSKTVTTCTLFMQMVADSGTVPNLNGVDFYAIGRAP